LPSSGRTGKLPSPTTHLPIRKGGAGKIVVMLSSVAKPPPPVTQPLPSVAPSPESSLKPTASSLPPKQVLPESPPPQSRLGATTDVKLPPKTSVPPWSSLSGASGDKAPPPPLSGKLPDPKKSGAQHIPPIKLNELSSPADASGESLFPKAGQPEPGSKPEGWKSLEAGELNRPETKDKEAPLIAPPLRPPTRVEAPANLPPPVAKPGESAARHVAPPLLEKAPEPPAEKLPQPHRPDDVRKGDAPPDSSESRGVQKVPALIQPEPSPKPLLPPSLPTGKATGNWMKMTTPLVLSSPSSKVETPKAAETKPALKPPVLSKRSLVVSEAAAAETSPPPVGTPGTTESAEKPDKPKPLVPALTAQPPGTKTPASWEKEKPAPPVLAAQPAADVPASPKEKAPLPPTRAERAKRRRFVETVVFWAVIFPVTIIGLLFVSLHFGRDTRVEGQIIPPPGMTLNNEVWIVTDFRSLAGGEADDLAKERAPLLQEIEEQRDHVQRVQADVAAREERIRLIGGQIESAKDEIAAVSKQARDATQQIWDVDGAEIDAEYEAHFDQLKQAIADRAKSLNLKYQPDETYQSPEVWANAYRLALYDVAAGVDTVKEHQWLGDQMKQWRDFVKTLDDRKEQLREKAALLKTSTGPRVADLNTRIDDLQQRIDATTAEEAPLKAELQQAQAELEETQTTEGGLDDKYYKRIDALPESSITKHISVKTNGRFTWVDDDPFVEGEKEHRYWIFTRATRSDGRQYWALHPFSIGQNKPVEMYLEPGGFISTKAILRPDLPPEEQEQ
jgi:predicted  nucleic acid-binding Zn-ribbon protein